MGEPAATNAWQWRNGGERVLTRYGHQPPRRRRSCGFSRGLPPSCRQEGKSGCSVPLQVAVLRSGRGESDPVPGLWTEAWGLIPRLSIRGVRADRCQPYKARHLVPLGHKPTHGLVAHLGCSFVAVGPRDLEHGIMFFRRTVRLCDHGSGALSIGRVWRQHADLALLDTRNLRRADRSGGNSTSGYPRRSSVPGTRDESV